ncbi:hypothetical protein [Desulfofustis limnaeus]|uniref:Uncharacterized protein n=1 Tax=Desulfofustis limnaeus TaxID=2740163 RepID=A0ABN6M6Z2_9BACT|nr:hypothetical protein [Desulfofustis limnaeus]BDD88646.1 hypothetical protein DPPLL_30110 [Desulfofustis limnaeus]
MEGMDYWRLCEEYTLVQAALLIVGVDPDEAEDVMSREGNKRPKGFNAVLTALIEDICKKRLSAGIIILKLKEIVDVGEHQKIIREVDPQKTVVLANDLKEWLMKRKINSDLFFPRSTDQPDFLNESHPHYSPKLAAAIGAWHAVEADPSMREGRSVKKALTDWLEKNAQKYQLIKEDGEFNASGIEEVAKIANWEQKGGAPKTPS